MFVISKEEKYKRFAENYRKTIEKLINNNTINDEVLKKFPYGCCGDISLLLAELLYEKNIQCKYVSGTYNNKYTHAWIEVDNNIIIDITGDQFIAHKEFLNYNKKVFVGKADKFHKLFINDDIVCEKYSGIEKYDSRTKSRLQTLYNIIEQNFEE